MRKPRRPGHPEPIGAAALSCELMAARGRRKEALATVVLFARAAVVGACGGLISVVFRGTLNFIQEGVGLAASLVEAARGFEPWWMLPFIPVMGAIFAYLARRLLVRGGGGVGLTDVMEAVSIKRGGVSLRSAVVRSLASLGILVSGGSVGREGPIISMSAGASSALGRLLRAPVHQRPLLLGCGVAAGFAGAYNAPFAGALFALEVVLGNFAMELFAPVVIASVTSVLLTHSLTGQGAIYEVTDPFRLESPLELIPYLALGVLGGAAAVGFQRLLDRSAHWFERMPGPVLLKMMIGGLAVGTLAIWFPEVWGNGTESVTEILNQTGPRLTEKTWYQIAAILFVLMIVKAVGTSITVGSGGAGGVFTPTLFVGAGLGGAFGMTVHQLAPHAVGPYGGYALVGMGCLVAGTTRAPIMAVMVVFEMTLDYEILPPLLLCCIVSSLVAKTLHKESIYTEKLVQRGHQLPTGLEEHVLVTSPVSDVMRAVKATVPPSMTCDDVFPLLTDPNVGALYVVDDDRKLLGVIRPRDVLELGRMGDVGPGIIAADLMRPVVPVTPGEPIAEVFEDYERHSLHELPVVDDLTQRRLIGCIRRADVMATLHTEVLQRQQLRAKFVHREDEERRTDYVELPDGVEVGRVGLLPDQADRTLRETDLRGTHGLEVMCVLRTAEDGNVERLLAGPDLRLEVGDELIVLGSVEALARWREQET